MLRLQLGLAFVRPDSLARFGGLLHLGLRLDDMERFLAGILCREAQPKPLLRIRRRQRDMGGPVYPCVGLYCRVRL